MFYSTQILAKKGPLGTIWIASHLERRLKRSQVFDADIGASVDSIINPEAPLALRLSGQLLLGVVKIHARKVAYLFADASDALGRAAAVFDRGDVDLPDADAALPAAAVTLPAGYADDVVMGGGGGGGDGGAGAGGLAVDAFAASLGPGGVAHLLSRTLGGADSSFLLACDASTLLPSSLHPSSLDAGGVFDVAGRDAERALSVGGETLRDAAALPPPAALGAASALFGGGGDGAGPDPSTKLGDTDVLEAPPGLSAGGGGGYGSDGDDGAGGWGCDDGWGAPTPGAPPSTPGAPSPLYVGAAAALARRRVRPRLDADAARGAPATQLAGTAIRALLVDATPLLRPPAPSAEAAAAALATPFTGVAGGAVADLAVDAQAAARAGSRAPAAVAALGRPLAAPFMAPELFAAVVAAAPAPPARAPRKRPAPDGEPAAAAAAAAATPAVAPADDDADAHYGWGGDDDGWGAGAADDDDGHGWGGAPAARSGDDADPSTPAAFTARTQNTLARVKAACDADGAASVRALAAGASRLDAARTFFEVLVLRSRGYVTVDQGEPYGDIALKVVAVEG